MCQILFFYFIFFFKLLLPIYYLLSEKQSLNVKVYNVLLFTIKIPNYCMLKCKKCMDNKSIEC